MDRLEKGWFDLVSAYDNILVERNGDLFFRLKTSPNLIWHFHLKTRHVPSATTPKEKIVMPSFSVMDAISQYTKGVPYILEGQWLCRKCSVPWSPCGMWSLPFTCAQSLFCCVVWSQSCMLCPNEGGAFKQTVNGKWVHLLCAIWVPETRVANEVFMEPVTGVEKINQTTLKVGQSENLRWSFSFTHIPWCRNVPFVG